ncbi:hypothetical protein EON64_04450, partial [archaeon]
MQVLEDLGRYAFLFCEQVLLMCQKHVSQKQRNGRQFWKDGFLTQLFVLAFLTYIIYGASYIPASPHTYDLSILPPLSDQTPWGVFGQDSKGNSLASVLSKRLYYCPQNHTGVDALISSLVAKYPQIEPVGADDPDGIKQLFEENLFDTWASMQFTLNSDQLSTGLLVTSQTNPSTVSYSILISPNIYQLNLATDNTTDTDDLYNLQQAQADLFWSSGYMTLQNFVATYLATQYTTVDPDYTVSTGLLSTCSVHINTHTFLISVAIELLTCFLPSYLCAYLWYVVCIADRHVLPALPQVPHLLGQGGRGHRQHPQRGVEMDRGHCAVHLPLRAHALHP